MLRKSWFLVAVGLTAPLPVLAQQPVQPDSRPPTRTVPLPIPPSVKTIPVSPPSVATTASPHAAVPRMNPGLWVTNNDYPTAALRAEQEGTVGFRVTVGIYGLPTKCEITSSSGVPVLDARSCELVMRRGRFYAATDPEGRPIEGTWSSRMRWIIPEPQIIELQKHPVPGVSVIAFTIDKVGFAKDCRLVSGADPETFISFVMPCDGEQKFPVYTDAQGNPVERKVRISIGVTLPGTQPAAPRKKRR